MKMAFTLAVLLCLYTPAVAAELYATPEPPAQLVEAIALQESGLNPFTVNIAGRSYYPATREKAKQLIQPLSLLDPAINESWGTWILAEEIARYGLNWKAVDKYHSPDPERGRRYAWLVYRHYAGLRASKIQEAPCAEQKIDSQNLSDPRGTRTDQSIGQQGRAVPFHVQQKGVPWIFRPKSGTSGGKD